MLIICREFHVPATVIEIAPEEKVDDMLRQLFSFVTQLRQQVRVPFVSPVHSGFIRVFCIVLPCQIAHTFKGHVCENLLG